MTQLTEEATSRFTEKTDIKLHYHDAGEGEAVIMLHGGGPGTTAWANFGHCMEPFTPHFRLLLLDQPGFGKSDKPKYDGPLGAFNARAIVAMMDELGIEKAHLVGNSMGGLVSQRFALDFPDRLDRLVLMGPGGGMSFATPMPAEGRKVLVGLYDPPGLDVERIREFIDVMVYADSPISDAELQMRVDVGTQPDIADWYSTMMFQPDGSGARLEDLWMECPKITAPTLLMWGRDDRVVSMDRAFFLLNQMPDARLQINSQCGHWVMLEQPDEFNSLVLDFLGNR